MKHLRLFFIIVAAIPIASCSHSKYGWTAGEISYGIEMCEIIGEGSFPEGFDTSQYCQCTTNQLSNSMTVDDAGYASINMITNIDNPSTLKGNSKLYFEIIQDCIKKFRQLLKSKADEITTTQWVQLSSNREALRSHLPTSPASFLSRFHKQPCTYACFARPAFKDNCLECLQ